MQGECVVSNNRRTGVRKMKEGNRLSTIWNAISRGNCFGISSDGDTVALLVLLSGPARAGIVSPDLRCSASGFGRFDGRGSGLKLHLLLLTALSPFDLFRRELL